MMDFDARTKKYSNIINNTLNDAFIMTNTPKLLHDAMKYSIDAGGKRIRPCLTLGVCDILGGNNAGIRTCWYNPAGNANGTGARVDYEIRSLNEIWRILEENQ